MTYPIEHQVSISALNHHVVLLSVRDGNTTWEYTWNHSTIVELWKCSHPAAPTRTVHVYPMRQLVAQIPAVAPDGEWATLQQVKAISQMHLARNIDITNRVLADSSLSISREQF